MSTVLSLLWAVLLTGLFGLGVWRRWRRGKLPIVGVSLLITALIASVAIAVIALQAVSPEVRRVFAFASWGAFTAAAVFYATVLTDP